MKFKSIQKHPLLISIIINVIIVALCLVSGTVKYEVSDDYIMQLVVSGGYGEPSPYIMFMSPIIGIMLSSLYRVCGIVNWYFTFQVIVIFIALVYIDWVMLKRGTLLCLVLSAGFTLFYSADLYQLMQFTKTATIVLIAGAFAGYLAIFNNSRKNYWPLCLFLMIGTLIRPIAFMVVIPLAYFAYFMLAVKKGIRKYRKSLILFLLIPIVIYESAGFAKSVIFNNDSQMSEYNQFHSLRSSILDYEYVPYDEICESLDKVGISKTDYNVLWGWAFTDPSVYTIEKLEKVQSILKEFRETHKPNIKKMIRDLIAKHMWIYVSFWFCLLCGFLILFVDKKQLLLAFLLGLFTLCLMVVNLYLGRLVYRVEFSFFMSYGSFLMILLRDSVYKSPRFNMILIFLLVALCSLRTIGLIPNRSSDRYYIMYDSWKNDLKKYRLQFYNNDLDRLTEYFRKNSDNIYFLDFETGIQTYYLAFNPIASNGNPYAYVQYLGGVDYLNPARNSLMNQLGCTGTLSDLFKENVYLVDSHEPVLVAEFLKNHYGDNVQIKLIENIGGFKIWKISK